MSIVTLAQSKGGSGKTTIAQILIGVVHRMGYSVGVIDGDINQSLSNWLKNFSDLDVECREVQDEHQMVPAAEELSDENDLVVIDTAGSRSQATVFAIGVSDLVLIPVQLSSANVIEAVKTYQLVQSASRMLKREVPGRVVFTDYTPQTNIARHIKQEVEACGLLTMNTKLHRLVAFQELSYGEVPRIGTAGAQADLLVQEIEKIGALPFMHRRAS